MKERVLVTGVGGRSVGAGVLHALMRTQPAVRTRWETLAADCDPFSWGLYVADRAALLPPAHAPEYLERIRELIDCQRVSAVIPGTEVEAELLARHRHELPVPVIANDARLMPLMMDKRQAERRLRELGVRTIPSYAWEQREAAIGQHGFPLAVKPTRGTGGSRGVHLVASRDELEALGPFVNPRARPVVQPYIGDPNSEYTVGVLSDTAGRVIDSIVIRRKLVGLSLLDTRRLGGSTAAISTGISQGFIVREASIQGFCEELTRSLGSRGPLNLQLRIHGGEPYVFEIHPRFSGTTPIRASAGFNEPDVLLRHHLHGERFIRRLSYRSGVAAIRAFEHLLVPIEEMLSAERSHHLAAA
jgi:carbamoyl-phosphate synthase large subunit